MDIKENLAKNLILYRKAYNLTQVELAEKLNYSDKAVSKWERAEAVPDLVVLKQIADIFNITIDKMLHPPVDKIEKPHKNISKLRAIICASATVFVWLIAVCCFSFISLIFPSITETWIFFIYAIPISFGVLLCFTYVWGKNLWNSIFASLLCWSFILAVYLSVYVFTDFLPQNLWMIFLIGIPLQILVIFLFFYRKIK